MPCYCDTINKILYICRITGVLPIKMLQSKSGLEKSGHIQSTNYQRCSFKLSKWWYRYSIVILVLFTPYSFIVHFMRFYTSNSKTNGNGAEWYLANFGYIINDLNTWLMVFYGMKNATKTANILTKTFMFPITIHECKLLLRRIYVNLSYLIIGFAILICTFSYVTFLRMTKKGFTFSLRTFIESGPGVIVRGLTITTSTAEAIVIMILCLVIVSKLQLLAQCTQKLLTNALKMSRMKRNSAVSIVFSSKNFHEQNMKFCQRKYVSPSNESNIKSTLDVEYQLECLSDMHHDLSELITDINETVSPLLLVDLGTCLYIAIFYLYRLCVSSLSTTMSNNQEIMHYVVSAFYRMGKLIMYMILGHLVIDQYKQPLRILQKTNLFSLPPNLQQQFQMLIVQWSITVDGGYLHATHVVYVGPWLLASMIGNIITYLLVALQFQKK